VANGLVEQPMSAAFCTARGIASREIVFSSRKDLIVMRPLALSSFGGSADESTRARRGSKILIHNATLERDAGVCP